ncbi:MAG: hypothetical protein M3R17_13470 [Bacteroidota bacterium]|nr:hypothetical protein [Bacteroidota bacterium]
MSTQRKHEQPTFPYKRNDEQHDVLRILVTGKATSYSDKRLSGKMGSLFFYLHTNTIMNNKTKHTITSSMCCCMWMCCCMRSDMGSAVST